MKKLILPNHLQLFGNRVHNFPAGIKEGFNALINVLPEGLARSYYGLSWMEADKVIYYTMAAEKYPGESKQYNFEINLTIEKGEYVSVTVHNWMSKTGSIKDVFETLMNNKNVLKNALCVEWYKDDDEMVCMMKSL